MTSKITLFLFGLFIFISFILIFPKEDYLITLNSKADDLFSKFINLKTETKLKEIHIIGRENITKELLLNKLKLTTETSIIKINLKSLTEKIHSINWIKSAVIERRMPHTLIIKIEEYKPFALLQIKNEHIVISSEGKKIIKDNGRFGYLPVINGPGSEEFASKMLDILSSEPALFHQVWAISFVGKRRWDISLRSGIKIKLPENNPSEAWTRLSEMDRAEAILSREFDVIDLRKTGHIILTPSSRINTERST
jgi:cell division protein FtsQ